MKIVHCPYIKTFLEAANKKYLVEIPRQNLSLSKVGKLEPLRDLDDRIISFSPFNKNVKYTQPSEYEDCFERMSFERPADEVDIWRDNELYRVGHESRAYINEPYSSDDVELAENISNKIYSHHNCRVPSSYYPDTDMSYDCKVGLKLLDFTEDIVPSSFPRQMDVNFDTIRSYAKTAVNAWEMGVPTNEIPKLITKSILKGAEGKADSPDVDLFNFLTKHPNERPVAVIKSVNGREFFDKSAALYYDIFVKKYFADSELARNILNECKTSESGLPTVNKNMCEIVTLLRRKSALGIPERKTSTYSYMPQKPSGICPIETPWGKLEAEILNKMKHNSQLDEDYFEAARAMLKDDRKTAKYVYLNIDDVVKRSKEISQIESNYEKQYPTTRNTQKTTISKLLRAELAKNRQDSDDLLNNCVMLDTAKKLQDRNVTIETSFYALDVMDSILKSTNRKLNFFNPIIDKCTDTKVLGKENVESLVKLCKRLYGETGSFGEKEAALIDKVCQHAQQGDSSYISALEKMIRYSNFSKKSIFKAADRNLDEFAKFIKRYETATKDNNAYMEHQSFIDSAIFREIIKFATSETPIKSDDCVFLNELENLCANKISYPEFLENLTKLGVQVK